MSKKTNVLSSTGLLALAVGVFLLLSGVLALIDQNSFLGKMGGLFADQNMKIVNVVAAILDIASGVVLIVGTFGLLTDGIRKLAFLIIVGFWALFTVWVAFNTIGAFKSDGKAIMEWFQNLSLNIAILASLWQIKPEGK